MIAYIVKPRQFCQEYITKSKDSLMEVLEGTIENAKPGDIIRVEIREMSEDRYRDLADMGAYDLNGQRS